MTEKIQKVICLQANIIFIHSVTRCRFSISMQPPVHLAHTHFHKRCYSRWVLALCQQCSLPPAWLKSSSATAWVITDCRRSLQENTQSPTLWMREPYTPSCQWDISGHWLCLNNTCSRFRKGKGLLVPLTMCPLMQSVESMSSRFQFILYGRWAPGLWRDCGIDSEVEQAESASKLWMQKLRWGDCMRWAIVACQGCDVW